MKKISFVFILFLVLPCSAEVWNLDRTEQVQPQTYCYVDGTVMANCYDKGPIGAIYEYEEKAGDGYFTLIRHISVISSKIGAWDDNGGGFKPLYYSYHYEIVVSVHLTRTRWDEAPELIYITTADVDLTNEVNMDDFKPVRDEWLNIRNCPYNCDVNRDSLITREDLDIVALLAREKATPSQILLDKMAAMEAFSPESLPKTAMAPIKNPVDISLLRLSEEIEKMNIPEYDFPLATRATIWGKIKTQH